MTTTKKKKQNPQNVPKPAQTKIPIRPECITRGDVYWINPGSMNTTGTEMWPNRPGIIVSSSIAARTSGCVQVVYLTTSETKRLLPTHVPLKPLAHSSKNKPTMALCEQIHTVDTIRLSRFLGRITPDELIQVNQAITFSLALRQRPEDKNFFSKWEQYIHRNNLDLGKIARDLHSRSTSKKIIQLEEANERLRIQRDSYRSLYENPA